MILRLSSWTIGFVAANQLAVFVVQALEFHLQGVPQYSYAYQFFQLPFGIIAVSVMSAVAPDLARAWSNWPRTARR